MRKLERPFARETAKIINRYISAALTGSEATHFRIMVHSLNDMFDRRIKQSCEIFSRMKLEGKKEATRFLETKVNVNMTDAIAKQYILEQGGAQIRYISNTTRKDVKKALAKSVEQLAEGEEPIPAEKRLRQLKALTPARATMIAATEIHASAMYAGFETIAQLQAEEGFEYMKAWVHTMDDRTRESHAEMNPDEFIPLHQPFLVGGEQLMYPGDPSGSAENIINCLTADSAVHYASPDALTRRLYNGKVITLKTASGNKLSVTPNHPILTSRGWVAAKLLKHSDSVISADFLKGIRRGNLDIKDAIPSIEQVYNTLSVLGAIVRVGRATVNFHGELPDADVDIINKDSFLQSDILSAFFLDPLIELQLPSSDLSKGLLLADSLLDRRVNMELFRFIPNSLVRGFSKLHSFYLAGLSHSYEHSLASIWGFYIRAMQVLVDSSSLRANNSGNLFNADVLVKQGDNLFKRCISPIDKIHGMLSGLITQHNATLNKMIFDSHSISAVNSSECAERKSRFIFKDKLVSIQHEDYKGYVYNLSDAKGYYIANGIVNHNCRCVSIEERKEFL